MKKYALIFAASYFLLTVILAAVGKVMKPDDGFWLTIAANIAASFVAAWRFVKDNGRRPTDEEKKSYALLALINSWIVFLCVLLAALALVLSPAQAQQFLAAILISSGIFKAAAAAGCLFLSAVYYVAIRWPFSWYANRACSV